MPSEEITSRTGRGAPKSYILVIRPEPGATDLQNLIVKELQLPVLKSPALTVVSLGTPRVAHSSKDGLVFTSANAVRLCSSDYLSPQPYVFCVGDVTARVAHEKGFTSIHTAENDSQSLIKVITSSFDKTGTLIYLRGMHVSTGLSDYLRSCGYTCKDSIVYKTDMNIGFSQKVLTHIRQKNIRAILSYSERTTQAFLNNARKCHVLESLQNVAFIGFRETNLRPLKKMGRQFKLFCCGQDNQTMLKILKNIEQGGYA